MRYVFCLLMGFSVAATAFPAPEVITACRERRAVGDDSTYIEADEPEYIYEDDDNCDFMYQVSIDGSQLAFKDCKTGKEFLIGNVPVRLDSAENFSQVLEIGPGDLVAGLSTWSKIGYNGSEHLCIASSVSDVGKGRVRMQYYIIENAFIGGVKMYYFYFKPV